MHACMPACLDRYVYNQTQLAYGWGDPSNIMRSPKDGYYYVAMWNRNQVCVCVCDVMCRCMYVRTNERAQTDPLQCEWTVWLAG